MNRDLVGCIGLTGWLSLGLPTCLQAQSAEPQQLPIEARWCLPSRNRTSAPVCIDLEVADTAREQQLGLMHRPPLPMQRGMWFPFERPLPIKMWMLNTPSALDMLFIRDRAVVGIQKRVPPCQALPCQSYYVDRDGNGLADGVDAVIELGAGEVDRLGITPGQAVRIEPFSPTPSDPPR